ncbi:hypothetical protein AB0I28_27125 [Phytomonospora sp. NPDC050363]|uniref:hypothetical protein n=1 Tax=Phytomonospora sp. NPDC050363 TaxID=3155642 RepID=UPI0033E08670
MSGGQMALVVVVAVVAVLTAAGLLIGRRSGTDEHRPNAAADRSRDARMADDVVDSMEQVHARMWRMVAEGRTGHALQLARAMYKTTERDPARWVADVAEELRAAPGKPSPDFGPARRLAAQGRTADAIGEYRRLTGAGRGEAEKVVGALAVAQGRTGMTRGSETGARWCESRSRSR